jgi:hypothetical protein
MVGKMGEAHRLEQTRQRIGLGAGEFDEFEAVEAERIVMRHGADSPYSIS